MNNIKAVLSGSMFIFVVGLTLELIFIILAVGYIELIKLWPFLDNIGIFFRYLVGFPVLFFMMFLGGYITAVIAEQWVMLNCLIVAVFTISVAFFSALSYSVLTVSGIIVMILALISTLAGGWFWKKKTANAPAIN